MLGDGRGVILSIFPAHVVDYCASVVIVAWICRCIFVGVGVGVGVGGVRTCKDNKFDDKSTKIASTITTSKVPRGGVEVDFPPLPGGIFH